MEQRLLSSYVSYVTVSCLRFGRQGDHLGKSTPATAVYTREVVVRLIAISPTGTTVVII